MITNLDLVVGRAGKAVGDPRRAVRLSLFAATVRRAVDSARDGQIV